MTSIVFRLPNQLSQPQGANVLNQQLNQLWNSLYNNYQAGLGNSLPTVSIPAPKKVVITSGSDSYTLDYCDPKVTHSNLNKTKWTTVDRAGTKPVVGNGGENLRQLKLSAIVGNVGGSAVDGALGNLIFMMNVAGALTIVYGTFEAGVLWRCTDFSATTQMRVPGTNDTWWCQVDLTFIEDSPAPYPAPVPATPAPNPVPAATPAGTAQQNIYTVKKGDTLSAIAVREYGNASGWPKIAAANNIRDPRTLQIGAQLTIP